MKFVVNYFPNEISNDLAEKIRNEIAPSMVSYDGDSGQYCTDAILEEFGDIEAVVDACNGCNYLEL